MNSEVRAMLDEPKAQAHDLQPHVYLYEVLQSNGGEFTLHDLGVLADWASDMCKCTPNPDWKRAYALIREGTDLLIRRNARSSVPEVRPFAQEPEQLNHSMRTNFSAPGYQDGVKEVGHGV